nr:MAG TPA: hypothetical protein [Caudoviricetes sp.]
MRPSRLLGCPHNGYYFNPRTREGCDQKSVCKLRQRGQISIHAPARGATSARMTIAASVTKFQSTHPRGVRPVEFDDMIHRVIFQSTHPRGVRHSSYVSHQKFESISIHAPARGATACQSW